MILFCVRLFCKNLGSLGRYFGKVIYRTPGKNCPCICDILLSVHSNVVDTVKRFVTCCSLPRIQVSLAKTKIRRYKDIFNTVQTE